MNLFSSVEPVMSEAQKQAVAKQDDVAAPQGRLQSYLDQAVTVLKKFNIAVGESDAPELIQLLDEVQHLDEAKILAIANTIKYMSVFNAMVRENVENIDVGHRYVEITQLFDSVRADSKTLIGQLDDGKISVSERMQNLWMMMRRGTPQSRFEKIAEVYQDVAKSTKDQLEREQVIMDGYIDFRFSLKEAEILAREVLEVQVAQLDAAKAHLAASQKAVDDFTGDDSERLRLELARDESRDAYEKQDRYYQLLKDVAENISIGYDVGETLVTKLKQTHDVKEQVYRRAVTFFTTNEHVFTILGTVYTSQHGLHEATQATEALKAGANKGLEDVAELGRSLERAALKAGYGSTISVESVEKLVSAISDFQIESLTLVADLRKESETNAREIRRVVEAGKQRQQQTLARFALDGPDGLRDAAPGSDSAGS